jgi:acetyl esterase/lipase
VPLSLRLAQKGYVAVTVSYRLAPTHCFPAQVHDVKCAVRWLRAHAVRYKVDPERIGVFGHSAGGHLACMLGTTSDRQELEGDGGFQDQSSAVCCVVCCSALTDLDSAHGGCKSVSLGFLTKAAVEKFVGGPPDKAGDLYSKASPITYAGKTSAPTLLIYGTKDNLVPVGQSERLGKKLLDAGAEAELLCLKGAAHDFRGEHERRAEEAMLAFFERHLRNGKAKR